MDQAKDRRRAGLSAAGKGDPIFHGETARAPGRPTLASPPGGAAALAGRGAHGRRTSPASRLYVTLWVLLAIGASAYAAVLGLRIVAEGRLAANAGVSEAQRRALADVLAPTIEGMRAELASLRNATQDMRSRLSELETGVVRLREVTEQLRLEDRAMVARVSALESRFGPALLSSASLAPTKARKKARKRGKAAAKPGGSIAGVVIDEADLVLGPEAVRESLTMALPQALSEGARPGGRAGKGARKVAARTSRAVKAPARRYGIEIARAPTLEGLRLSWALLGEKHADLLRGLQPRYVGGKAGRSFALVAGPFASKSQADRLCATLAFKGLSCSPTPFTGKPL